MLQQRHSYTIQQPAQLLAVHMTAAKYLQPVAYVSDLDNSISPVAGVLEYVINWKAYCVHREAHSIHREGIIYK